MKHPRNASRCRAAHTSQPTPKPPRRKNANAKAALRTARKHRALAQLERAHKVRSLCPARIRKNQRRTEYFA